MIKKIKFNTSKNIMKKSTTITLILVFLFSISHAQTFNFELKPISTGNYHTDLYTTSIYGNEVYFGGHLTLKKLTGNGYENIPGVIIGSSAIKTMKEIQGKLYIGSYNISVWNTITNVSVIDGVNISALPSFPASIAGITEYNGEIYGIGKVSDGVGKIAKLVNGNWVSLPNLPRGGNSYSGLVVFNNELYAYGHFNTVGPQNNPIQVQNIAKWNGTSWSSVGTATPSSSYIRALYVWNNKLITSNYDVWDGTQWTTISAPSNGEDAWSFTEYGGSLFSETIHNVNYYNESNDTWTSAVPPGQSIYGIPIARILNANPVEDALYLGHCSPTNSSPHKLVPAQQLSVKNYTVSSASIHPNPTKDILTIQSVKSIDKVNVYNVEGKSILITTGSKIDLSSYPSGVYFLKIIYTDKTSETTKVIKE